MFEGGRVLPSEDTGWSNASAVLSAADISERVSLQELLLVP